MERGIDSWPTMRNPQGTPSLKTLSDDADTSGSPLTGPGSPYTPRVATPVPRSRGTLDIERDTRHQRWWTVGGVVLFVAMVVWIAAFIASGG